MDSIPQHVVEKLMLCGLSKSEAFGIYYQIQKWFKASGPEWTVQHLKLIKQTILSIKANHLDGVSPYVKTRNHRIVGPFRAVQRLLERGDKKALQALMVYTNFVSSELTKTQESKFIDAVTSDRPDYWYDINPKAIAAISQYASGIRVHDLDRSYEATYHWVDTKYAPVKGGKTAPESDKVSQLEHLFDSEFYRIVFNTHGGLLPEDSAWFSERVLQTLWPKPKGRGPSGKISVLQEPGFKARFIANPNRVIQHSLTPLGDWLFRILSQLPWDCTFDQKKAAESIQARLKEQKKAYCYDLSNATDMMPLRTQVEFVYSLVSNGRWSETEVQLIASQLRLFQEVARLKWTYRDGTLSWARGQPLGLYPSFAIFALTHGAILLSLCEELSTNVLSGPYPSQPIFYVVGDDVVILDDELAKAYESKMADLEIPISKGKSIISDTLAEFTGEVITREHVFIPVKWRQVSTKSFADFIKVWGYEAIPLLPGHIRPVAEAYAEAPEPVGLGLNPRGKPLGERLDKFLELYFDTFTPPISRVDDGQRDLGSLLKVMEEIPERLGMDPHLTHAVSIHPDLARTERNQWLLQSKLEYFQFLSNEDLTSYVKLLVDKGE